MKQHLKGIAYIIGILMIASSIYYAVGLGMAYANQPEPIAKLGSMSNTWSPCPEFKVDTIWHGHGNLDGVYVDYGGSGTQEYDPLLKRLGCTINQQIVIELDPMENHSEIIN